jgi:hypothetical protein
MDWQLIIFAALWLGCGALAVYRSVQRHPDGVDPIGDVLLNSVLLMVGPIGLVIGEVCYWDMDRRK